MQIYIVRIKSQDKKKVKNGENEFDYMKISISAKNFSTSKTRKRFLIKFEETLKSR